MMEYAPGGELFVRLAETGSYTELEARPIFAQIASAVQYMVSDTCDRVLLILCTIELSLSKNSFLMFETVVLHDQCSFGD